MWVLSLPLKEKVTPGAPAMPPPHFPRKSVGIEVKVALEDIKSDTQEDILPIQE